MLLACIGLHGVTSYVVARRTSEIGIPAAAAASKTARAMRFGVEPADPWSIPLGAGILFLVAVSAGYIPARRAARLDPLVPLRTE